MSHLPGDALATSKTRIEYKDNHLTNGPEEQAQTLFK